MKRASLLAALTLPCALAAQEDARQALVRIPEGATLRVRLRHDERTLAPHGRMARVAWVRDDSVRFTWVRQGVARTVAWTEVARLDTLGGRAGTRANAGAVVGAALGFAAGLAGGFAATWDEDASSGSETAEGAIIVIGSTIIFAGIGHWVGRAIPGSRRWVEVWP